MQVVTLSPLDPDTVTVVTDASGGSYQTNLDKIKIFHRVFNHPVSDHLNIREQKLNILRIRLIAEELAELAQGLGYEMSMECSIEGKPKITLSKVREEDPVEVADAVADLEVVVLGTYAAFGLPGQALFDETNDSNMSKAGADGKPIFDEFGKIMKGPNYWKADVKQVLLDFNSDGTQRAVPFTELSSLEY